MSTNHTNVQQMDAEAFRTIDHAIRGLLLDEMEHRSTAIADTPGGRIERLVTVYTSIKPLLAAVSMLPVFPESWRSALALFVQTLDAVAASPLFKAGKDL
jgi:hypothetical protein